MQMKTQIVDMPWFANIYWNDAASFASFAQAWQCLGSSV